MLNIKATCAPCGRERPHESSLKGHGWYVVIKGDGQVVVSYPTGKMTKGEFVCSQNCAAKTMSRMLNELREDVRRRAGA